VTLFPGPGQRWHVSSTGATTPRWRRDGKALFAIIGDDVLEFPIKGTNGSIQTGGSKILFQTAIGETLLFAPGYDTSGR